MQTSPRCLESFAKCNDLPDRMCWNCRWKHVAGGMLYCRKHPAMVNKGEWEPMRGYDCWSPGRLPSVLNVDDTTIRRWRMFGNDLFGNWQYLGSVTGDAALAKHTSEHKLRVWQKENHRLLFDIAFEVVAGVEFKAFVPNNELKGAKD